MKGNKYTPYILGPVLILIWGTIFYKIYRVVYPSDNQMSMPSFQALPSYKSNLVDTGFALLLDYQDPFLDKRGNLKYSPRNNVSTKRHTFSSRKGKTKPTSNRNRVLVKPQPNPIKPFPSIVFQGFQTSDGDTSALIRINNQFYAVAKAGQIYQGVLVEKIYKDSIRLRFEGQSKSFSR